MERKFLPVFAVNRLNLLDKLSLLKGDFGILATSIESNNFLESVQRTGKTYFIDSGVFEVNKTSNYYQLDSKLKSSWCFQINCKNESGCWTHQRGLATKEVLTEKIRDFLDRCDKFSPDFVFAPDVIGEPLISLHLARLAHEVYSSKPRSYQLIGVVQVGDALYNWQNYHHSIPQKGAFPPYYQTPKSFLSPLISEYHRVGYKLIALGGLLRAENTMPMGLKFGLSNQEFDNLLAWSRPDFILGGLALSRVEILRKHKVWADSTNWLWWDSRYDYERFGHRNALHEVVN